MSLGTKELNKLLERLFINITWYYSLGHGYTYIYIILHYTSTNYIFNSTYIIV